MSGIKLGWIDISKDQRNKVLSVMHLLSEAGTMDELGVGIVRDTFSDLMFPGTSTIQTRAKYFLIVPYILYELELTRINSPEEFLQSLYDIELKLINSLRQSSRDGIIGIDAGASLKRKPSDIYWNGIRRYGIFTKGGMSLYEYARVLCSLKNQKQRLKDQGNTRTKDDETDVDDVDAITEELLARFWKLSTYTKTWQDQLSINLSYKEAEFLKNRIVTSCPDSLLAYVLRENDRDFLAIREFADLKALLPRLPQKIKAECDLAIRFADFLEGAHLRYNLILSKYGNPAVNRKWDSWSENLAEHGKLDLNLIYALFRNRNSQLRMFLNAYQDALISNKIKELDALICKREVSLKGASRSKLYNANDYEYTKWVGIDKLHYRFKNAQTLCSDIFEGLKTGNDKTAE